MTGTALSVPARLAGGRQPDCVGDPGTEFGISTKGQELDFYSSSLPPSTLFMEKTKLGVLVLKGCVSWKFSFSLFAFSSILKLSIVPPPLPHPGPLDKLPLALPMHGDLSWKDIQTD